MQKKQTKKHQKAINDFKTNKCGYLFIQYMFLLILLFYLL